MTVVAALDVGGTKTLAIVTGADGRAMAEVRVATAVGRVDTLLEFIIGITADVAAAAGVAVRDLAAIGVGIPGLVDPSSGTVRNAVNLGLDGEPVPVGARLATACGVRTVVANDVDAAALGAARLLDETDVAYLSVGTGVAAGFVLDGRLRQGSHGGAGEIGHLVVDPGGPSCACGQRGCLEAVAAGPAIGPGWPAVDEVELRRVAGHLAAGVTLLALTVDPRVVVLGGGVVDASPALAGAVRDALAARSTSSGLLRDLDLANRLVVLPGEASAGALGAALLALDAVA